jgi:hypothetical protein
MSSHDSKPQWKSTARPQLDVIERPPDEEPPPELDPAQIHSGSNGLDLLRHDRDSSRRDELIRSSTSPSCGTLTSIGELHEVPKVRLAVPPFTHFEPNASEDSLERLTRRTTMHVRRLSMCSNPESAESPVDSPMVSGVGSRRQSVANSHSALDGDPFGLHLRRRSSLPARLCGRRDSVSFMPFTLVIPSGEGLDSPTRSTRISRAKSQADIGGLIAEGSALDDLETHEVIQQSEALIKDGAMDHRRPSVPAVSTWNPKVRIHDGVDIVGLTDSCSH